MLYRSETLSLVVWGELGNFTKAEFRSDRLTHPLIPPTAAEGVVKSISYHPEAKIHEGEKAALGVEILEIHVLNPIRTESLRLNEIGELPKEGPCRVVPRQTSVVVVTDPKYLIKFCYVSRTSGAMVKKAAEIFKRRMAKGQCFQQTCLGRRRYPGYVRNATKDDVPINVDMDLGRFPWRVEYSSDGRRERLQTWDAKLRGGVLVVPSYLDAMETSGKEADL